MDEATGRFGQPGNGDSEEGLLQLCDYSARKAAGVKRWEAGRRQQRGKSVWPRGRCKLCFPHRSPFINRMYRRREIQKYVMRKNKQSKTAGFVDSLELPLEPSRSEPSVDQEAVGLAEQGWSQQSREPFELTQFINATHQRLATRRNPCPAGFNSLASSHSITSTAACSLASWECVDGSFDIQSVNDGDLL